MGWEVRLQGPLDVAASIEGFRRWGDDLIDRWDGTTLLRTVPVDDRRVAVACTVEGDLDSPRLRVEVEDPDARPAVEAALRSSFVLAPDAFHRLVLADPVISRLSTLFPGLRPVLQLDLLTALVRSISAQQVNLRWAATTRRRLAESYGVRHEVGGSFLYSLDAERLVSAGPEAIRALQFTTRKAEYIVAVAQAVAEGLEIGGLSELPDDEVISRLVALRGIGLWTAEWILARTLGRPRVVAGDLGVRKAVGIAYLGGAMPTESEVRSATSHWGDAALVAQALLLHGLSEGVLPRVASEAVPPR